MVSSSSPIGDNSGDSVYEQKMRNTITSYYPQVSPYPLQIQSTHDKFIMNDKGLLIFNKHLQGGAFKGNSLQNAKFC